MSNRRPIDERTGFDVNEDFERFDQRNEIYCRSEWDPEIKSKRAAAFFQGHYMPHARARKADGFSQRDYALRNATWHVTNVLRDVRREEDDRKEGFFDTFTSHAEGWPEPYPFESAQAATKNLRRAAKSIGAGLLGICEYDERWVYRTRYSEQTRKDKPVDIPGDLPHVIVIGEPMDIGLTDTVPSALSGSATGMGYTHDTVVLLTITQYIRNLGYRAVASMNDSALAIPLAAQAGLGEVGRHSLLITKEFGPRLRLGKIFTDMPLVIDEPIRFGVKEFCDICQRCSTACPPKAITQQAAVATAAQRFQSQGRSQVDHQRREVFPVLGGAELGLLHLHPGLPLPPRLPQVAQPGMASPGRHPPEKAHAVDRRDVQCARAQKRSRLVGAGRLLTL